MVCQSKGRPQSWPSSLKASGGAPTKASRNSPWFAHTSALSRPTMKGQAPPSPRRPRRGDREPRRKARRTPSCCRWRRRLREPGSGRRDRLPFRRRASRRSPRCHGGAGRARAIGFERDLRAGRRPCLIGGEHGGAAGGHVAALALPVDGPAAALIADIVGALAGDDDARGRSWRWAARGSRSSAGPAIRARPRGPPRGVRASRRIFHRLRSASCERLGSISAHGELDAQDAGDGVVDAGHGDHAFVDQLP